MGLLDWLRSIFSTTGAAIGTGTGPGSAPTVPARPAQGVSSFHCWWLGLPNGRYTSCSVTLEVLDRPDVNELYFWALQASFEGSDGRKFGGAHTGLQWNPRHPDNRAVNWGGYDASGSVSAILQGSLSPLPSTPNDVNTRDFPWQVEVPYRFTISLTDDGWLGEIADLSTGDVSTIRTLFAGGDRLTGFVVWSEVFAGCRVPTAAVRWSDLTATTAEGVVHRATGVSLTYPGVGACPNNESALDESFPGSVLQRTNTTRRTRDGQNLIFAN